MKVEIVTSAHWPGDPRLNRHRAYLQDEGHQVSLQSFSDRFRANAVLASLARILGGEMDVVILADPELFLVGSLAARLRGARPVIDIHEDYAKVAAGRNWVPRILRPLVGWAARLMVGMGRLAASSVLVAAPQLARRKDVVVLNVPDPSRFPHTDESPKSQLVYVGDITEARGALEMVETMGRVAEEVDLLLIGRVGPDTRSAIESAAESTGVTGRVLLTGRLEHGAAWGEAAGSLAGLSLLRDVPAYREAVATKLWEYMAAGIPPIVSDLPGQRAVVSRLSPDLVCSGPDDVASIVHRLQTQPGLRRDLIERGREMAEATWHHWRPDLALNSVVSPPADHEHHRL